MTRAEKLRERAAAMLAKAEAMETGAIEHGPVLMTHVRDAISEAAGLDASRIQGVIRYLHEEGVRPTRRRGHSAETIPPAEAATILVGTLASASINACASAAALLLKSPIMHEAGCRPPGMRAGRATIHTLVEDLFGVLTACPTAVARFQVNQTDLSALVQVEMQGANWEAFFAPLRVAAGDRREIAAVTDVTLRAVAHLYRGAQP